jgi:hypothetical protein
MRTRLLKRAFLLAAWLSWRVTAAAAGLFAFTVFNAAHQAGPQDLALRLNDWAQFVIQPAHAGKSSFGSRRNRRNDFDNNNGDGGNNNNNGFGSNNNGNSFGNNSKSDNRPDIDSKAPDQRQARQDRDRDDDDDNDNKKGGVDAGSASRGETSGHASLSAPPHTMVELFRRLLQPPVPATGAKRASGLLTVPTKSSLAPETVAPLVSPHKPHWGAIVSRRAAKEQPQPSKPTADNPSVAPAKAASRTAPLRRAGVLSPSLEFAHGVISGVNLSQKALDVALSKGFTQVGAAVSKGAGIVVTYLAPPPGRDAMSARALLQAGLPTEGFALGQVYRPYHVVADDPGLPAVSLGQSHTCSAEHCYGTALIKWQPALYECTARIKVGVIDTNIDHLHPAFQGRHLRYGTFLPPGAKRAPDSHGTGVLALLSGNPQSSTPGLIPNADFYVADTFFMDHTGQAITDSSSLVAALEWMNAVNVDVVNLSLVGPKDEYVRTKIREMSARGIVFVAAAGNEGHMAPPSYPAAYKEVIAVTAVDHNLQNYRHANRGSYIDLAAPGVQVWTALPSRKEGAQTGTSFAVPFVTAVVAATLPATALKHSNKALDPLQPKKIILARLAPHAADLGTPGYDTTFGYGLVQAPKACTDTQAPPPSAFNTGPGTWSGAIQPASWIAR